MRPTCVVCGAAMLVPSKVQLIDVHSGVLETVRLAVEKEVMQIASIVHGQDLR